MNAPLKLTRRQIEMLRDLVKADLVSDWKFGAATKTALLAAGFVSRRKEKREDRWSAYGVRRVTVYSITESGRAALADLDDGK